MKKKLTVTLLILVFGFLYIVSAKANTTETSNVSVKAPGLVVLRFNAANSKLTILDSKNKVVYTESISGKNATAKLYNITALPEGEYFFEVVENGVKTVKSVTYKKEIVSAKPLDVKVTPSSVAGKFELVLKNSKGDVNVTIYSKTEGVVYEDAVVSSGSFKRTYDLSKLKDGEYTFEVSSNERFANAQVSLEKSQLSLSK